MSFQSIGDIADVGLADQTVSELTWETETDWEVNVYNENIINDAGILKSKGDFSDGFEDGTLSKWENNTAEIRTDRTLNGSSYSMYGGANNSGEYQSRILVGEGGAQVTTFTYHYQETSNSTGAGFRFKNSSGSYEGGVATDNPEWDIVDGNGVSQVDGGSNYDDWHKVTVTFDWSAGTFDVDWENLSTGRNGTYTDRPLKVGDDVEYFEYWEYNGGTWGANDIINWIDDVSFDGAAVFARAISVEKSFGKKVKPCFKNLNYTLNGGEIELTAVGSPGTDDREKHTIYLTTESVANIDWQSSHETMQLDISLIGNSTFSSATLYERNIELDSLYDLYPDVGDQFTFTSTVTNNTTTSETFDVTLSLPSELSTSDTLTQTTSTLGEGQSESVSWTINADLTGKARIDVDLIGNTSLNTTSTPAHIEVMQAGILTWDGKREWDNSYEFNNVKHYGSNADVIKLSDSQLPGSLTTRIKEFPSSISPDVLQMDYSTNVNKVTVDVIGSPNTQNEEIKTLTLVGNPSQEINTWSTSHTSYQLKIKLEVDSGTVENTPPTFKSISLGQVTSDTSVKWSTTADWDANEKDNGVSHSADVVTFSPVWREEYSFPFGNNSTTQDLHHNAFTAQRDFYGHARVTSMNSNGWSYNGTVEFGKIIDPDTEDWDKIKEVNTDTLGDTTEVIKDLEMEQYEDYFIGYSRGSSYYSSGEENPDGEVVGSRATGFMTQHRHPRIGTNNGGNTLGFSKLEFKESYIFSGFKYMTKEAQPNISNIDYDLGMLDSAKLIVIGSPETPNPEKHEFNIQGEQFKRIPWSNSHLKFQFYFIATDSDGTTSLNSLALEEIESPNNVSVVDERESEVDLSWNNPVEFDEIRIYRSPEDSHDLDDYTIVETLLGSATSYTDAGLTTWEDYYYIVVGVDGSYLGQSNPESAVPQPANVVGWHSEKDWDDNQGNYGLDNTGINPRLLKAEPELAQANSKLEYYFTFDGNFIDHSGNRNHGTITNANINYSDDGITGQCLEMTAGSAWAGFNHFFNSSPAFGSATISVWAKNNQDNSEKHIILTYDQSEYFALYVNGQSGCGVIAHDTSNNTTTVDTNVYIDDGEWHHIAVVFNRYDPNDENVKVYIDSVKEATSTRGKDQGYGSGMTRYAMLGRNTEGASFNDLDGGSNQYFEGKIDDLRFYRAYAMTDEEIQKLYDYGKRGAYHITNIKTTPTDSQLQ